MSGETTVEWGVREDSGYVTEFPHPTIAKPAAENLIRWQNSGTIVRRTRTRYPDRVTDWHEVPTDE